MKAINKFFNKTIYYLLAFSMLCTTLVLCVNVILRYVFHSGFSWAEEFSRYLIVWVTFIGTSACITEGFDISIATILDLFSVRGKKVISVLTILLSILFMGIFTYYSLILTMRTYNSAQLTTAMKLPMYVVYGAMPLGGLFSIIRYAQKLKNILRTTDAVKDEVTD